MLTSIRWKLLSAVDLLRCPQSLEQATSLEEVTAAHSAFLEAAMRQCLLAPDKTWKLIENAVHRILNLVLQFTTLQRALRQKVSGAPHGKGCSVHRLLGCAWTE